MKTIRNIALAAVLAAGLLAGSAAAGGPAKARLQPAGSSRVAGTATLTARGAGTTVALALRGLRPRASFHALLHAGTCARSGASFALVAAAKADATGTVRSSGSVLFHAQPVGIRTIADGGHVIAVVAGGRVVACGVVPRG
jgi:hypothetical protein